MAADLVPRAPPAKWADVPLPPPPAATAAGALPPPVAVKAATPTTPTATATATPTPTPTATATATATPTSTATATPTDVAAAGSLAIPAEPLSWQAYPRQYPLPQFLSSAGATPPTPTATAAAATYAPAPSPQPASAATRADGPAPAVLEAPAEADASGMKPASKEPKVNFAADRTGAMLTVTQDLESDKVRMAWAKRGGTIPAFEANGGLTMMYKDLSQTAGAGSYMSGLGFNGGFRVSILNLSPPKYETRDRGWTAFKIGAGIDLGAIGVTISTPVTCYPYAGCFGGNSNATMTSTTLVTSVGFMRAFGSFDGPDDWSGFAIGAEWAPSYQSTSLRDDAGNVTTSSSFNASGFALNFESGSLQSMASKMGKKAHVKLRLFMLPPVGELPLLVTGSVGAVWY